jgi:hypothetical protein
LKCGDVIQSQVEGQFVRCSCGAVAVDALRSGGGMTRILGECESVRDPEIPEEVGRGIDDQAAVKAEIQRLVLRWAGSEGVALDWLSRLCPGLGASPQELIVSGRGELVLQHLRRIGDGGYA